MLCARPVNASSSTVIFLHIVRRASCASTLGLRSSATSAASMSRPEAPKMSETTTLTLIWSFSELKMIMDHGGLAADRRCAGWRL